MRERLNHGTTRSATRRIGRRAVVLLVPVALAGWVACRGTSNGAAVATPGGQLRIVLRSEPRTFNPVMAVDAPTAAVSALLHGELFAVDASSQDVVPELAEALEGPDASGAFLLRLRRGVRFPDGESFGADDVVFSLRVYQDAAVGSPQRQALLMDGRPIAATPVDDHTVTLRFGAMPPEPARVLAGVTMLPRHRLEAAHDAGSLAGAWPLTEAPANIVGLGPFQLEQYTAGERITFVRNPVYWRRDGAGQPLPYLERVTALFVSDSDAQTARLVAGEVDVLSAIDARSYASLESRAAATGLDLFDVGPSLEYTFLVLNLDHPTPDPRTRVRARWFHDVVFRRALSQVADRAAMARLVYEHRATPLVSHVSPGNRRWHAGVAAPAASVDAARALLAAAGYRWDGAGRLLDARGTPVAFSILTSTSNAQRQRLGSVLESDLRALGIDVRVVALEFRAYVERLTRSRDFDAAIMALGGGDADPNAEANVWRLDGSTHVWRPGAKAPLAPWEAEIDALMRQQAILSDYEQRRRVYGRVQALVAEHLPIIPLVSPNHLVAARRGLHGLSPGVTSRDSLWNVDRLSWVAPPRR